MTRADYERFKAFRKKVMQAVGEQLKIDFHCKSYDGALEIIVGYPNYFEDDLAEQGPDYYCIRLHCYVLGPGRHYDWFGRTFAEALGKADKELESWIKGGADNG